jgi:hypothetical protein
MNQPPEMPPMTIWLGSDETVMLIVLDELD